MSHVVRPVRSPIASVVAARWPLSVVAGTAAVGAYLAFSLASYASYPGPYGPLDNWLSDLGNATLNPAGALLYNTGVVLTGLALAVFFYGLRDWTRMTAPRVRRRIMAAQILGYAAAAATLATAFVSESADADLHGLLSMIQIELLGAAVAMACLFLYRERAFWRPVVWLALAAEVVILAFAFVLHTFWMEWVAIALQLACVALLALNTRVVTEARRAQAAEGLAR